MVRKTMVSALVAAAALVAGGATATMSMSQASATSSDAFHLTSPGPAGGAGLAGHLSARSDTLPYHGAINNATTIRTWSNSITVGATKYTYKMVGKNPTVTQTTPGTTVPAEIVPVKFVFTSFSNLTFDPAAADSCAPSGDAPLTLIQQSPLVLTHSFKAGPTVVGTGQYASEFQRANFWKYTKPGAKNPKYAVNLKVTTLPEITVNVSGGAVVTGSCPLGALEITGWDNFLQTQIFPSLTGSVSPTTVPIFVFNSVVFYHGTTSSCCALGYHSAFSNPAFGGAFQTYVNADFDVSGNFSTAPDISPLSHELGEWMDDPSGTNPVPAWGHIGQQPNCQSNLEVGDPLAGHTVSMSMPNGVTYHPQELAFFSWFYQQATSIGVNGWYSSNGTFLKPSTTCT